eukprot:10990921-Alexandrium_andersonii.AAC.1
MQGLGTSLQPHISGLAGRPSPRRETPLPHRTEPRNESRILAVELHGGASTSLWEGRGVGYEIADDGRTSGQQRPFVVAEEGATNFQLLCHDAGHNQRRPGPP